MADPSKTNLASRASTSEAELLGAVRALSEQVGELQAELQSVRSASRSLPSGQADVPGWEVETPARRDGSVWMRSVASPAPGRPAVPRLLLEILFLVAVACLAAVARLDTPLVVVVMTGAWALVALAEWATERSARLGNEAAFGRYTGPDGGGSWSAPSRASTYEVTAGGEAAAKLPPPAAD
ncbi:MAG: hypothetical protein ACRDPZ_02160 [Gaiellaceae bacterium]